MSAFLRPTLELLCLLPGLLLAYLPFKQYLRVAGRKLAAGAAPLILLASLGGGWLCQQLSLPTVCLLFPITVLAGLAYMFTLRTTRWKTVSVYLAVCGVFSCLGNIAKALELIFWPGNTDPWLTLPGALCFQALCWIAVAVSFRPATHAARALLEDDGFARTWYVFWILPLLFVVLNLYLFPIHPELMHQGRFTPGYLVIGLALLALLLLFYTMFYLMAASLNRNNRLRQENQFLSMQQSRYDNLRASIAETREARHDMRHHIHALQSLAARQDWEHLVGYLRDVEAGIPDTEMNLCDNPAVDSVAGHYSLLCRKQGIPFTCTLDLPARLPVPEIDFCLILSNLLENAVEASLRIEPDQRQIKAQAYLRSGHMLLLTVENAFDGEIREKDGVFQSSKRRGEGIGIQSVRHIADKNGGYSRFTYDGGVFQANVMLRAEK